MVSYEDEIGQAVDKIDSELVIVKYIDGRLKEHEIYSKKV